jgi:hypothetical protein
MRKIDKNVKLLADELKRLSKVVNSELNNVTHQMNSVIILNENIRKVQRGLNECQHTFEILVEALLHAQDGIIQPQLITMVKIKNNDEKGVFAGRARIPFLFFHGIIKNHNTYYLCSGKLSSVCYSNTITPVTSLSSIQDPTLSHETG